MSTVPIRKFWLGPDHVQGSARGWADLYSLPFVDWDGEFVSVRWPDPDQCSAYQLVGRARMLDRMLATGKVPASSIVEVGNDA